MSLVVKNLTKIFGQQIAVNDVSFEAQKGEIMGFLGQNGAGKSTTMKIATGYLPPSSGSVEVAGFDVVSNPTEAKKRVGYLPEQNPLYADMYVQEFLHFVGRVHGLKGNERQQRVNQMLELCGLQREQHKKIAALSKGYKQRVGFAQALIHQPEVLILDEPTNGFDPNQMLEIRNVIRNMSQEKTVIFSTHILQEVKALCQKVVIIDNGKIIANCSIEELSQLTDNQVKIVVEFGSAVPTELLEALEGVQAIRQTDEKRYEITANSQESKQVRTAIFQLAVQQNWTLTSISEQEIALENVFQKLTRKT